MALPAGSDRRSAICPSTLKLLQVRLRIPAILLISALVVGRWDVIRNYWDRLTRPVPGDPFASQAVSNDTEYFCPMDPGVVSDWPGKCGICNMALVRRKRGEAVALPDGVVARMQISPYRVQLAGIQTAPLGFQPLERTLRDRGHRPAQGNRSDRAAGDLRPLGPLARRRAIRAGPEQGPRRRAADRGQAGAAGWRRRTRETTVREARSRSAEPAPSLRPGMIVEVRFAVPASDSSRSARCPPTRPPLRPGEPRRLFACPEHPDSLALEPGRCPIDHNELEARPLADNQRVRWWCPMHPAVTADRAGAACDRCGGMILKPRVVSFRPAGKVLAVPESAVVDTGSRTVVFVETMPGMFDGVEVVLGPRCGDSYPVVRGLEAGQKVAISGAFLLDAETRLNPSLAAATSARPEGVVRRQRPTPARGSARRGRARP